MFQFIFNCDELDEYYKNNYIDLLDKSCYFQVKYNDVKIIKIISPKFINTQYNENKLLNFIKKIQNNKEANFYFNNSDGNDGFEYNNQILRILTTEHNILSNTYVEIYIDNINQLCDEFIKFNNWWKNF